ncbi:adenine phosphoribosyltransferase [Micrococcales bacterium 31B]|nr:adenine phosphoribosyltransferase [Micrococcales bacterium 31B]
MTGRLRQAVRSVPDFPSPGVLFRDVTPILADADLLNYTFQVWHDLLETHGTTFDVVMGLESRGFIFGAPLAQQLGVGFVPARKPGKLPDVSARVNYDLEYGASALELPAGAVVSGQRVLIVDDVLATGGTAEAACRLVEQVGAEVAAVTFLIDVTALQGMQRLRQYATSVVLQY